MDTIAWEYASVQILGVDPDELNALGAEGWEVILAIPQGRFTNCLLKRPVGIAFSSSDN